MGKFRVIVAGLLGLASAVSHAASPEDLNGFLYNPAYRKSHMQMFGKARGTYFISNGLIGEQIYMGRGIPGPNSQLSDGTYLITGCRRHDCPEKSAVIVTKNRQILAAALVHYPCAFGPPKQVNKACLERASLTIFVTKTGDRPFYVESIKAWAQKEIADLPGFELGPAIKKHLPLR